MTIQRISTYAVHQSTLRDSTRVQSELANLQGQLSSGKKTDKFLGLDGNVEQFVQLDAKIRKTDVYINNNELVLARLNTTQVTMEKLMQVSDDMENLMVLRRNPANADNLNFAAQLDALRKTATSLLNTTFEGRFIFGGTRTDTPPVMDPQPAPIEEGVPDAGYYQGSNENLIVRSQDNFDIEYNVRADNSGFQKMFAAIDLAISADTSLTQGADEKIQKAIQLMQDGLSDMNTAQTKVNGNIVTLTDINARHNDLKLYWKGVKDQAINTDIVSASTAVALNQAILQASFQTFARINQLKLSDYL
jgi:flagellar hook-associated protein 3 FlgL